MSKELLVSVKLATVCLPWQQWTETSVWFDDVGISAFHSCVVVDLWQSCWVVSIIVWVCFGVPSPTTQLILHRDNVPAYTALSVREILASKQTVSSPQWRFTVTENKWNIERKAFWWNRWRLLWRPFHKMSSKIVLKGGLGSDISV
jgi:hypothetical protein